MPTLTKRKHSEDDEFSGAWEGTEFVLGIRLDGASEWVNNNYAIQTIHTFVGYGVSDLPSAASETGRVLYAENGIDGNPTLMFSDGNAWFPISVPTYDFGMYYPGTPPVNEVVQRVGIARPIKIPADFAGATGSVETAPASSYELTLKDDGTDIGTITIDTNGDFTFATESGTEKIIDAGSFITVHTPAGADSLISDIAFTIPATLYVGV